MRSTLWTGRPLRALATPYIRDWEVNRRDEIEKLQSRGLIVFDYELDRLARDGKLTEDIEEQTTQRYTISLRVYAESSILTWLQTDGVWCGHGE